MHGAGVVHGSSMRVALLGASVCGVYLYVN
jgi:hypothetical protein